MLQFSQTRSIIVVILATTSDMPILRLYLQGRQDRLESSDIDNRLRLHWHCPTAIICREQFDRSVFVGQVLQWLQGRACLQ